MWKRRFERGFSLFSRTGEEVDDNGGKYRANNQTRLGCILYCIVQDNEYSGLEDAPLGRRDAADAVVGDVLVSYWVPDLIFIAPQATEWATARQTTC